MTAKRLCDLVLAAILLVLLLPFGLLVAVGIKLVSPGPVFYRGQRTGWKGRPFRIFKFRTMIVDADQKGGGTTALDDPRVFRLGRFLRRTKLDELPQLLNVVLGDMSFVGPRPELLRYTNCYSEEEREILSVRPGITDPSSIRFSSLDEVVGSRDADRAYEEVVLPQKNRMRLVYVRTRSFWGDWRIVAQTIMCVLRKMVH